jgi:hypothetical protein
MERRLGEFAKPYHAGRVGTLATGAKAATLLGGALMVLAGRRRAGAVVAGTLLAAGALAQRLAVVEAGRESARASVGTATVQAPRPQPGERASQFRTVQIAQPASTG